ncbi:MAG TPA: hypothetical protein PLS28_06075 [Clostridiales bacterium]|nr:hypothetical protein [Clostridiales bacterium]
MKEKERLYTAKLYLEKLASGRSPFDDTPLPEDALLNNVYLCRTFMFTADLLGQILEHGGPAYCVPNAKKEPFSITEEERAEIELSASPIGISDLAERINAVLDLHVKALPVVYLTKWLEAEGLLQTEEHGRERIKCATEEGKALGIFTEERVSHTGHAYQKTFYATSAQRYLIAHLEEIADFGAGKMQKKPEQR